MSFLPWRAGEQMGIDTSIRGGGWTGRLARVDLAFGRVYEEPLDPALASRFLGGRGLGAALLFAENPTGVDPLGPDNVVVLATGPLTGTQAPTPGRFSLSTRSPLTGCIHDSNAGGNWGTAFKKTGRDALILKGRAPEPSYLLVTEDRIEIRDASLLWGKEVSGTVAALRRLHGPGAAVLCIGPAGERLVPLSAVAVDGRRFLARGGVGAVFGAKNLKAVVAVGSRPVTVADPEAFSFICYEAEKLLKAHPVTTRALPRFGTPILVNLLNEAGAFPAHNFRASRFEGARAVAGERIAERTVRRSACRGCRIACRQLLGGAAETEDEEGIGAMTAGAGAADGMIDGDGTVATNATGNGALFDAPEYESLWALGPNVGLADLNGIVELNRRCGELGLDTISAGGTLACALELAEAGLLSGQLAALVGSLVGPAGEDPSPGKNPEPKPGKLIQLLEEMARREGPGALLAEGSRALAARAGSPELAMQVKGLELPAYDPRAMQGQGLGYATSNRGGCHLRGNMLGFEILGIPKMVDCFASTGKAGLLIVTQHTSAVIDSIGVCKFSGFALGDEHFARLLSAATGVRFKTQDLQTAGERIWNLERLYNLREGFTDADDTLPARLLGAFRTGPGGREPGGPEPGGLGIDGDRVDLAPMLVEYYRFRGWTPRGIPTSAKLRELELEQAGRGVI